MAPYGRDMAGVLDTWAGYRHGRLACMRRDRHNEMIGGGSDRDNKNYGTAHWITADTRVRAAAYPLSGLKNSRIIIMCTA